MSKFMECTNCGRLTTDIEADDRLFNTGHCAICNGTLRGRADTDKSELEIKLEDFIHDYKVNTPDGWEWKKLVELDEVKSYITQQCNQARIDELKRHFIPHGVSQLETVYRLPGKRLSAWGTTDAREAYNYRLAELQAQAKETEGA